MCAPVAWHCSADGHGSESRWPVGASSPVATRVAKWGQHVNCMTCFDLRRLANRVRHFANELAHTFDTFLRKQLG